MQRKYCRIKIVIVENDGIQIYEPIAISSMRTNKPGSTAIRYGRLYLRDQNYAN